MFYVFVKKPTLQLQSNIFEENTILYLNKDRLCNNILEIVYNQNLHISK